MTKNLEQYRLPAQLRRRPPMHRELSRGEDGVLRVSVTPKAFPQEVFMDKRTAAQWSMPSASIVYPLRSSSHSSGGPYTSGDLASAARMLEKLRNNHDVREDRISEMRAVLASENYSYALKMEKAIEKLLSDLVAEDDATADAADAAADEADAEPDTDAQW
jgi:hypothetical protein